MISSAPWSEAAQMRSRCQFHSRAGLQLCLKMLLASGVAWGKLPSAPLPPRRRRTPVMRESVVKGQRHRTIHLRTARITQNHMTGTHFQQSNQPHHAILRSNKTEMRWYTESTRNCSSLQNIRHLKCSSRKTSGFTLASREKFWSLYFKVPFLYEEWNCAQITGRNGLIQPLCRPLLWAHSRNA